MDGRQVTPETASNNPGHAMRPTILLTRPEKSAARFTTQLRERLGRDVGIITSPLLEIRGLGGLDNIRDFAGLIFTSANAVPFGASGMRCYAVGDATAQAAEAAGMTAISAGSNADGLIRRILADREPGPLLHIRGEHSRGNVAVRLTEMGCPTTDVIAYRQVAQALTTSARNALTSNSPVIVPIFSPRTAEIFDAQWSGDGDVRVIALSPAVAEKFENIPSDRMTVAKEPTAQAMLDAIERLMDAASPLEG